MLNFKYLSVACAVVACTMQAHAEAGHQWEVTAMVGRAAFDNERNLEDTNTGSLGLGYRLNNNWTVEGFYQDFNANIDRGHGDVDGRQLRVDALYHLAELGDGSWRPFVLAGLGDQKFDAKGWDDSETFANVGLGIKKKLSSMWQLRSDIRALYSFDEKDQDLSLNLGLSYLFGANEDHAKTVVISEKDSDRDGVMDSRDQCLNTPLGAAVNSEGCPVDSDLDGVFDYQDKCFNTPHGVKVNAEGCVLARTDDISFDLSLRFIHNGDEIESHDAVEVKKLVSYLKRYSEASIVVEGHTDSTGSAAYNKSLSERRAAVMVDLLIRQYGINETRLSSVGYGEQRPIADNNTATGRAANRRVVAKVVRSE